ncbi:DUF192 domain-containing protein [Alicyclobacillus sp. SO9]|uniref:DUF192 domain-containing protein n=1 Tax=Alicyclobacillus sp. SO9 TaxID=2665646 RepID=UPI0018E70057|nr:DUF192 domain-containing protein [Alicyclobacillus sp. SO9]
MLDSVQVANSHWLKFRGLMLKSELGAGEGMLFPGTNAIHCFFMRIPIDLVFMDSEGVVVRVIESIKPWRIAPIVKNAVQVLECKSGTVRSFNIKKGNQLVVSTADQPF